MFIETKCSDAGAMNTKYKQNVIFIEDLHFEPMAKRTTISQSVLTLTLDDSDGLFEVLNNGISGRF